MGEEKKNTEPVVLPEQKTQDEIYEEALEKAKQKTAEREAREAKQRVYYTQLAGQIYDLDEKVVETLGSSLGRVFNHDRERCIANMVHAMEERPDEHIVRSEVALIGNMARTIQDRQARREIMSEYDDIMHKLVRISRGFSNASILDRKRARLNSMTLGNRFRDKNHLIICISRTYGSGGNNIGFGLADALKINYYDAEIFNSVLKRLEAEQDGVEDDQGYAGLEVTQTANPGMSQYRDSLTLRQKAGKIFRYHGLPRRDAVFFNQSEYIIETAKKKDFVVLGRCADVILRNAGIPHVSIFITAPFEERVRRTMEMQQLSQRDAARLIRKQDRLHARFYKRFTGLEWGSAVHYDLCINSSSYGIEECVRLIHRVIHARVRDDLGLDTITVRKSSDPSPASGKTEK